VLQNPFKDERPRATGIDHGPPRQSYKPFNSKGGHYRIYAQVPQGDKHTEPIINRRLAIMEDTLNLYYWFARAKNLNSSSGP